MGYPKGRKWTAAHREAHWRATHTDEFREKSRQTALNMLASSRRVGSATDTPIERRLQDALRNAGIGFRTQVLLLDRYLVDILLTQAPVVIEADGAHHMLPTSVAKDAARDQALRSAGYTVYRFCGGAVNRDAAECVRQVAAESGLSRESEPVFEVRTRFAGPDHPRWKGGPAKFTCANCGSTFTKAWQHRQGERAFCTKNCYGEWMSKNPDISGQNRRVKRDWSELAKLYGAGMSTKKLALHYGCSQKAVLGAMRRLGIPIRPQGGYRPKGGSYQMPD